MKDLNKPEKAEQGLCNPLGETIKPGLYELKEDITGTIAPSDNADPTGNDFKTGTKIEIDKTKIPEIKSERGMFR